VLLAYLLYGLLWLSPQIELDAAFSFIPAIGAFGLIGFVTGLASVAMRKLESESLVLAASTVAAFVAMMFGFCTGIVV
jgi:hypothetical protein